MSTLERRMAARANQRAAAFVRFQMTGDIEGMQVAVTAFGRERDLDDLQTVATSRAVLSEADDIDFVVE